MTVHAIDCPRVMESDPERRVEVAWDGVAGNFRPVTVEVMCIDEPGSAGRDQQGDQRRRRQHQPRAGAHRPDKRALNTFEVMVDSVDALNRVMRGLGKVRGGRGARGGPERGNMRNGKGRGRGGSKGPGAAGRHDPARGPAGLG